MVCCSLIPKCFESDSQTFDVNCVPLSVMIDSGMPKLLIQFVNAFPHVSAVGDDKG